MQRKYNGVTLLYFAVSKGNKKEPIGRGEWNGNYVIFYCKTKHEREMHRKQKGNYAIFYCKKTQQEKEEMETEIERELCHNLL